MSARPDPEYARWLQRNATLSVFVYGGLIAVLLPLFHYILRGLPGVPAHSDSLALRCAAAAISLCLAGSLVVFKGLRRYAVTMQFFNALVAVVTVVVLVVNSGNHYAYVASGFLVIIGAQQAFYRVWDLAVVFAAAFALQVVYSALHGVLWTPMNLAALVTFGAGYLVAFVPGAMRIRIQESEIRTRLEAQRVKNELQTVQDALVRLARFDPLTGLPNRTTLSQQLAAAIDGAAGDGSQVAVVFLDLDRFKDINDTLGHELGDRLLREISRRFFAVVPLGGVLARWGGDEFVAVAPAMRDRAQIEALVGRFIATVAEPFEVDGLDLTVTVSAGIAIYPKDGDEPGVLIRNADTAMYEAKSGLESGYAFFTSALHAAASMRHHVPNQLRRAIAENRFILHYQPLVDAESGAIVGAEALVRWNDVDGRMRLPGEFIAIAEESGVIVPLGAWVLRAACEQMAAWHARGIDLGVAVNVSPRQFSHGDFITLLDRVLRETGANPAKLQIEITEAAIMSDVETVLETLRAVRELGIRVAIDDFGSGYSSFAYLKRFDVDTLKIDRMFVQDIEGDRNRAIAKSIVTVAHTLGLSVTAEGVETQAQSAILGAMGCDRLQGYHLGYPLPVDEFETAFVAGRESLAS